MIAIVDSDFRLVRVNKAMADRLGTSPHEYEGQFCYAVVHGSDNPPRFYPHMRTVRDYCEHSTEMSDERLCGDFIITTSSICDSAGKMIASVHVIREISERKRT